MWDGTAERNVEAKDEKKTDGAFSVDVSNYVGMLQLLKHLDFDFLRSVTISPTALGSIAPTA